MRQVAWPTGTPSESVATAGGLPLLATQSSPATRSEMVPVPCLADSWLDISLDMLTPYFRLSKHCVIANGVVLFFRQLCSGFCHGHGKWVGAQQEMRCRELRGIAACLTVQHSDSHHICLLCNAHVPANSN